ncbi:MAG: HD domain-containing protein [Pseudomonadota bacterium]
MSTTELAQRMSFLTEIDALKGVLRASPIIDQTRRENTAEHSWHLSMYALVLAPLAPTAVNIDRVVKMLLVHDVVEIDAGDTPIHGGKGLEEQAVREEKAAERLFGLLPKEQEVQLRTLWEEFEAAKSQDARFAKALDRLQPLIQNVYTDGGTWAEANVSEQQVYERYGPTIKNGSEELWGYARELVRYHFNQP